MGFGSYSLTNATANIASNSYTTKAVHEVFTQRTVASKMSPYNVGIRESRDSAEHPMSLPIIIGLDVTGSMGSIPHYLISQGLPNIMEKIFQAGEKDPQIMFVAVGDHECDRSPLQVSQFESSDELLDKWLKQTYLEGGGGGNDGESYSLAWYFAGKHTATDSFEKRGKKGILFTIGDEPVLNSLPAYKLQGIMGNGQFESYSATQLLDLARKTYEVYHIHVMATMSGQSKSVQAGWKELMGENVLFAQTQEDISKLIAETVIKHKNTSSVFSTPEIQEQEDAAL